MNCGDCPFETHYENELFEHLKMHLRKDANIIVDTQEESKVKKEQIEHSVEQRTIYEEDDCLHCGLCTFSSKSKKNMLRHSNIVHGVVINDKVCLILYKIIQRFVNQNSFRGVFAFKGKC